MLKLPTYLVGIVFILFNGIYGQGPFCPDGLSPAILDPKWRTIPERFEIMAELVASDGVMEVSQAFSPTRDAIAGNARTQLQFYWDFATNEKFTVIHPAVGTISIAKCLREVILPQSETSVITKDSLVLKPSVILGFNARNQRNANWGLRYEGDGELRGIPTNIFKSCFFVDDIKARVQVTYHVSDVEKFHAYLPRNTSIILQLDVDIQGQTKREQYQYNVFRYSPNPNRREERQALETPSGLYCAGRIQTKHPPSNIPERASSNVESYLPALNNTIFSTHSLYDTEFQYTRFDAWYPDLAGGGPAWYHMTEIHDFAVGLSYHYNNTNRQCRVTDIAPMGGNDVVHVDGNPNLFQMGNPQHLFLMDDIEYQYTGQKHCRDRVMCDVWIGEKPSRNNTVQHIEWYWAISINGETIQQSFPVKLIIKQLRDDIPVFIVELSIFNFRRNPLTILEIDNTLAECYRALGPAEKYNLAVLSFKIGNEKNYSVYENLNYLRLHIWETLIFTMFVRPTRISHLIVDHDGQDILVTFTLLDAPPRTGPVEDPIKEAGLDKLVERLSSVINANGLAFRARTGQKTIVLRAKADSLNVVHQSTKEISKSSGPRITGLWLGLIFVGILVGGVGGFFVFQKLAK